VSALPASDVEHMLAGSSPLMLSEKPPHRLGGTLHRPAVLPRLVSFFEVTPLGRIDDPHRLPRHPPPNRPKLAYSFCNFKKGVNQKTKPD
jgi:hypothetical protein